MPACLISLSASQLAFQSAAPAEQVNPDIVTVPVGESGRAYEAAKRFSGVEADLIYLRPEASPEDYWERSSRTRQDYSLDPQPGESVDLPLMRTFLIVAMLTVLGAIILFAIRVAPNASINILSPGEQRRRGAQGKTEGRRSGDGGADSSGGGDFIARLQAMADRREAIVLLLKRCLERALEANNMALGRSQTAREILYHLPRSWLHIDALAQIVRTEERVQFRGEDIAEEIFQESVELAKPLLGVGTAAQ